MAAKKTGFLSAGNGLENPCGRDCADRKAGCAIDCPKWREYVEKRNEVYKARVERGEGGQLTDARKRAATKAPYNKKRAPGYN